MSSAALDSTCDDLVREQLAGLEEAGRIRDFLVQRNTTSAIDPRWAARTVQLPQARVEDIFARLAERGILEAIEMIECAECQALAPASEVREAQAEGDEYPCPGSCDQDLADDAGEMVIVYRPLDTFAAG